MNLKVPLSIGFLNCKRLDQSKLTVLPSKLDSLEAMLRKLHFDGIPNFDGAPDFLCLCEVGSYALALELANRLGPNMYRAIWSGKANKDGSLGMIILYKDMIVEPKNVLSDLETRRVTERCRWMMCEFQLKTDTQKRFWLGVNHWESSHWSESAAKLQRHRSSAELSALFAGQARLARKTNITDVPFASTSYDCSSMRGQFLAENKRVDPSEPIILVGDFNCEPWDHVFRLPDPTAFWQCTFNPADVADNGTTFYNPMVKAPGIYETYIKRGMKRLLDQFIVSPGAVKGDQVQFAEQSINVVEPILQATDHYALGAVVYT